MFCANCGKELAEGFNACATCGAPRQPSAGAAKPAVDVSAVAADTRGVLTTMFSDPVAGLPRAFVKLGNRRAMEVGIAIAILGALLVVLGVHQMVPSWARPRNAVFGMIFVAVTMYGSLVGAAYGARQLFKGTGSSEGDVFVAAVSLTPIAVLMFLSGLIGIGNFELIGALAMFAFTWTVLMLYSGVTSVLGVPESKAAYAVPLMLMVAFWLTSVISRAML